MKTTLRTALLFTFNVLAGTAIANDLQVAAVAPAKTELVSRLSQAIQGKDWYQSEKLANAAISTGRLTPNEKTAALNNLCVALTVTRAYTQALDACNQSVAASADRAAVYVNRGNLYSKMGKTALAKTDYAKAKALAPHSDAVDINIAAMRWNEDHHYVALIANYDH